MASKGIPLDTAAIMSTVLEGILYGFSILMFIGTMWALTYKKTIPNVNRPMALVAILLLMLSTAHMVVDIVRTNDGLVSERETFPGGPPAFFGDVAQQTFVIKNAIYTVQTLLGDGVVIYRCYVVWQSIWVIILPSLMWCGVAVSAIGAVYSDSHATNNSGNIYAQTTGQWITAFYISTLAANLMSSGLLAYRIWAIKHHISSTYRTSENTAMPILRVLVDSAILYSVAIFSGLICFICSNNGQYIILDMSMPIISITFYMVLIRIAISRTRRECLLTNRGGVTSDSGQGATRQYAMKSLQVHISQFTHSDSARMQSPIIKARPLPMEGSRCQV